MIPADWLPPAKMQRVVCHWTAGKYAPNAVDLSHYHILITGNGTLVKGKHSIRANAAPRSKSYAAHTLNCNTGSIGISMCSMEGAREVPFNAGKYPFTKAQWDTMAKAVADLCRAYKIPVKKETVLSHAEVQRTLGIKQRNKWDIARCPWDEDIWGARTIGNLLREQVEIELNKLDGVLNPETAPFIPKDEEDRPAWAYNVLRNLGWSHVAAVALVGNAQQEAFMDLRPHAKGDKHIPGGSVGFFQWNRSRREAFEKYAASRGKTILDDETNLFFADLELRTTERTAGDALRAAQTVYSACRAAIGFLRPQDWSALEPHKGHGWKNRLNNAIALDKRLS